MTCPIAGGLCSAACQRALLLLRRRAPSPARSPLQTDPLHLVLQQLWHSAFRAPRSSLPPSAFSHKAPAKRAHRFPLAGSLSRAGASLAWDTDDDDSIPKSLPSGQLFITSKIPAARAGCVIGATHFLRVASVARCAEESLPSPPAQCWQPGGAVLQPRRLEAAPPPSLAASVSSAAGVQWRLTLVSLTPKPQGSALSATGSV